MTVNERSVDGGLFPRVVFSCSGVATSEDWRHGALSPTVGYRRRDVPGASSTILMLAVSENSLRPSRDKRWATGGQLPSLIRRRSLEADVVDVVRPVRRADRRRDVCRGPDAVDTPSRAGRGRRDGTPVARTMSQVGSRADGAPGAHQEATAFRRPTSDTSPSVSTCRGVFGIGWSASAASGKA